MSCALRLRVRACTYHSRRFASDRGENRSRDDSGGDRCSGWASVPSGRRTTHGSRLKREATQDSRVPRQKTRKTRIVGESRRFRVTACTASTVRPSSCALTTALPGVLTDSARLGSARHTVRRSAAQTRRGERCGGGACPLQTTPYDWSYCRLRAHFGSYARGSVQPAISTNTTPLHTNSTIRWALDFLFFFFFFFFVSLPFSLFLNLQRETCRISSATRRRSSTE